ncbi:MAG TPA: Rrf2 family transcriptional regulator [Acetobacteraceae bacterium]|nr:Rrf2 family transcriptional regulator [Acetobacteraceae bacterium]
MRLTSFTDYTLRALIYLGLHGSELTTIADIAAAYDISANHLMKVVHQLALAGDVETVRGQHGGIRLARAPEAINIGRVVRRSEADLELVECFGAAGCCAIQECCVLKGAVAEALAAFLRVLDRYTLADLIAPRQRLAELLGLSKADPQRL